MQPYLPIRNWSNRRTCTNLSCEDEATATVLVGNDRMPKCFTHEREYADRFGSADIYPLRVT